MSYDKQNTSNNANYGYHGENGQYGYQYPDQSQYHHPVAHPTQMELHDQQVYSNGSMTDLPPPLPPKPPLEYIRQKTNLSLDMPPDPVREYLRFGDTRRSNGTISPVSELPDRRPSLHPLGPRHPSIGSKSRYQNRNDFYLHQHHQQQQQQQQQQQLPLHPSHYQSSYQQPQVETFYSMPDRYPSSNDVGHVELEESSSVSSRPSSVHRTTSTNTAYSRSSLTPISGPADFKDYSPMSVQPDTYSVASWEVDEPAEIPIHEKKYALQDGYGLSDDEGDAPSFLSDIRQELNSTFKLDDAYPPVSPARNDSFFVETPKPSPSHPTHSQLPSPIQYRDDSTGVRANSPNNANELFEVDEQDMLVLGTSRAQLSRKKGPVKSRTFSHELPTRLQPTPPQRMKSSVQPRVNPVVQVELPRSVSLITPASKDSFNQSANSQYSDDSFRSSTKSTDGTMMLKLNLPSIPDTRIMFDASRLTGVEYSRCEESWSLQCICEWISLFKTSDNDMLIDEISKALVGLFTHTLPNLNWVKAEEMASNTLQTISNAGFIIVDEESKLATLDLGKEVTGVLPLLTLQGCYTYAGHWGDNEASCYSPKCSRVQVKKEDLKNVGDVTSNSDWAAYWKMDDQTVAELDKREARRQYAIHELIVGEEGYVRDLNTLLNVYGDSLKRTSPPIMKKQSEFWETAFGTIKAIVECNTQHLLSPFKYRQKSQGPYIESIGDIILTWAKFAKDVYVKYADSYVLTDRTLRIERERNVQFSTWFNKISNDPRTNGVPHSFYFHRAIPRLARYGLLLSTIQKGTLNSDPEWQLLEKAINECNLITGECNKHLAEVEKRVEMMDMQGQISFKSSEEKADLKLQEPRRKVVRRGDVIRRGDFRLDWVDTHLILFDHFLVVSKIRKSVKGNQFYVTKKPIPLDLLVLESADGEGVTKSSASKLGVGTFTSHVSSGVDNRRVSVYIPGSPISPLKAQNSDLSVSGSTSVTLLNDADKEILYPFRITHLGRNGKTYTLYAPSNSDRGRWKDAIISAKREYNSRMFALNVEPFRVKVLSEYAFGYESSISPRLPVFTAATALDRALNDNKVKNPVESTPRPLAKSHINCGVSFIFADGQEYQLLGLDYGVYVCSTKSGHIWRRCIDIVRVSQIDVIEELNVVILLADKALVYYNLDIVLTEGVKNGGNVSRAGGNTPSSGASPSSPNSTQFSGYKLSKHREVGFFAIGHMKDRTLLFYKRRDGMSSTFKILEPIKEKGSQKKRSKMVFNRGASLNSTEYFREVEKFYVPTESSGINLFKTSFAVHTTRGFEVMSLDVKLPQTVPAITSVTSSTMSTISKASNRYYSPEFMKKRIESARPVGMFRISESTLVLCYEEFAIYCDNHGNITGPTVIEFVCKAKDICIQLPYLIAFDEEMIEVRRIDRGGQLKQIISGKDIRVLDKKEGQIKIALAHPELSARQLVVELIGNDFVVEDDSSSLTGF